MPWKEDEISNFFSSLSRCSATYGAWKKRVVVQTNICECSCRGEIQGPVPGQPIPNERGVNHHNEYDDVMCTLIGEKPLALVHRLSPGTQALAHTCWLSTLRDDSFEGPVLIFRPQNRFVRGVSAILIVYAELDYSEARSLLRQVACIVGLEWTGCDGIMFYNTGRALASSAAVALRAIGAWRRAGNTQGSISQEGQAEERMGHMLLGMVLGYPTADLAALHAALWPHQEKALFASDLVSAVQFLEQHHMVHISCSSPTR